MAKTIRVPKTPASAYNPKRAASSLITAHIANLEAAAREHVHGKLSRKPRTEAQAARYIAELTKKIHPHAEPPTAAEVPRPAAIHALAVMPPKKRAVSPKKATGKSGQAAGRPRRKRARGRGRKK